MPGCFRDNNKKTQSLTLILLSSTNGLPTIGVNAGTHPRQYLVGRGQKVLYYPKVCQNCYQTACRNDAYGATNVCGTSKTPGQSERVIVFILHELWRHPLCTFRLCLHVGINARWASVTYFLFPSITPSHHP